MLPQDSESVIIRHGNTFSAPGVLRDENGDPEDLTGAVIRCDVRRTLQAPEVAFSIPCVITDAAAGTLLLALDTPISAAVIPRDYVADVRFQMADGRTFNSDPFTVTVQAVVTRAA
jgi:UDP-N-acetylglucosamine transferase subunit ALG13